MANEEVMNEMDMENEGTLITLEDEEGNEVEFEFLDIVEYDGEEYIVLIENDEDADEVVILKINPVDEETEEYVSIEDEDLLDTTRKPRNMSASRTRTCSTSCSTSSRKSTRAKSTSNKAKQKRRSYRRFFVTGGRFN